MRAPSLRLAGVLANSRRLAVGVGTPRSRIQRGAACFLRLFCSLRFGRRSRLTVRSGLAAKIFIFRLAIVGACILRRCLSGSGHQRLLSENKRPCRFCDPAVLPGQDAKTARVGMGQRGPPFERLSRERGVGSERAFIKRPYAAPVSSGRETVWRAAAKRIAPARPRQRTRPHQAAIRAPTMKQPAGYGAGSVPSPPSAARK